MALRDLWEAGAADRTLLVTTALLLVLACGALWAFVFRSTRLKARSLDTAFHITLFLEPSNPQLAVSYFRYLAN
eukprot:scaffold511663_cov39-Prasinocladus_malaysianus.AAC.1